MTAFVSAGAVIAFAAAILVLARSQDGLEPPQAASRGLVSVALLAVPGLIGAIGAWARRPTVVIAAGVLCLLQSVVAFSGVTLVYLLPAIGFLRGATEQGSSASPRRPWLLLLGAILAVPIAAAVVLFTGIFGVLLLAIAAGILGSRPRNSSAPGVTTRSAARGLAIVLLVIGAWLATFAWTETECWIGRSGPDGTISWEEIPPTNSFSLDDGATVGTCSSGVPTEMAIAVASLLLAAAIGVAVAPDGSGARDQESGAVA
ncbi:MAG TPA: hypothetical protein VFV72_09755 [Candidatus Limnocylindrales bacterium]|nr:hypothetical protein [Candidatus Limnocylindrales bacterium]